MSSTDDTKPEGALFNLSILATSDVHATVLDYDYSKDQATRLGSLARAGTVIRRVREQADATLLVDNGDFLQGAAIADPQHADGPSGDANPVIQALNALDYDAVGLGNHEFNVPTEQLRSALSHARFPVLCANLHPLQKAGGDVYAGLWHAQTIVPVELNCPERGRVRLRVGIFSVLPPQVVQWDALRIRGRLVAEDMVVAARRQVAALQEAGVDLIIALAHSGIADMEREQGSENVATQIAAMDGVDVVVAGHVHRTFPGVGYGRSEAVDPEQGLLCGKPAVMPGVYASHLGQISLSMTYEAGRWVVAESAVILHDLAESDSNVCPPEDGQVRAAVANAHEATLVRMRRPVGRLVAPVTSYFSMIRDDCASRLVAEAKLAYVRAALQRTGYENAPLIASVAPLKCGGRAGAFHYVDVPPGDVSLRALSDMQPYANHISVVQLKGRDVVEWLEKGCAVYNQLLPGRDGQFLYDRDAPTYNREVIYGLSYGVDLSQPARYAMDGSLINPQARRVVGIRHGGVDIAPDQDFLLVTNDYRGGGGGNFPAIESSHGIEIPPAKVRDVLAEHIRATSGQRDDTLDTWHLRPLPQTRAVFDTGPGALPFFEVAHLPLINKGTSSGGFLRVELNMAELTGRPA